MNIYEIEINNDTIINNTNYIDNLSDSDYSEDSDNYLINDNLLKLTMKNIRIPKYEDVYLEYLIKNPNILHRNDKESFSNDGKISSHIYKFKNIKFIAYKEDDCNRIDISFHRNKKYYLHIMIDKSFPRIIYIICIKYYKNTFEIKFDKLLVNLAINYIIDYSKNNDKIDKICLLDNNKSYYFNM